MSVDEQLYVEISMLVAAELHVMDKVLSLTCRLSGGKSVGKCRGLLTCTGCDFRGSLRTSKVQLRCWDFLCM